LPYHLSGESKDVAQFGMGRIGMARQRDDRDCLPDGSRRCPWPSVAGRPSEDRADVRSLPLLELAPSASVDSPLRWATKGRLLEPLGYVPRAEFEQGY